MKSDAVPPQPRIAIVGGGITGLAAAHRITELRPQWAVTVFDADSRLGGVLQTEQFEGFMIERSADMFSTREPWALDLCERIGLTNQLLNTNVQGRKAMVVCRGALQSIPDGFTLMAPARLGPMLRSGILSWKGKLRLACEPLIGRRRSTDDESLESFAVRRAGREAFERIIQPLISGIYTADPARLSMQAALPQFVEMERTYGSITRALRRSPLQSAGPGESGARYGLFVAPQDGMESLVKALVKALVNHLNRVEFSLGSVVGSVRRSPQGRCIVCGSRRTDVSRSAGWEHEFDGVILATRAPQAGPLLEDLNPALGRLLQSIPYAGAAVVILVVRRDQVQVPIQAFGFVVPLIEKRRVLAASFSNLKFTGRAPDDHLIIRTFVGGDCQPELLAYDDNALQSIVRDELGELIGLKGTPRYSSVARWNNAMPQYHVGHLDVVQQIEQLVAKIPGFELAGNAYHGVGIPFCIQSGAGAAERLIGEISSHLSP